MDPKFAKFPFKLQHVKVASRLLGGLQFYPVDRFFRIFWFAVPYYARSAMEDEVPAR